MSPMHRTPSSATSSIPSSSPNPLPVTATPPPTASEVTILPAATATATSDAATASPPATTASDPTVPVKRRRRGGKRVKFQHVPRPPIPVRSLWTAASEEEKQQAHKSCSVMLAYWLGKIGKTEAAAQLCVSELRVWQLSQQALAGMAAGLLKQPRTRRILALPRDPEEDPATLKRRIAQLSRELLSATRLVDLLKDLPAHRASAPPPTPTPRTTTNGKGSAEKRSLTAARVASRTRARRGARGLLEGAQEANRESPPRADAAAG